MALSCLAFLPRPCVAAEDAAGIEFFESKIRPILVEECYRCHSQDSPKVKGGLLLDTRDDLRKGGDSGPAIAPGNPDKSLLIKAVRYTDEDLQMPPKGKKLSADKIAALEAWVKMGAPDPRTGSTNVVSKAGVIREKALAHWAFLPVREPAPPAVKNQRWVQTPVDNFVLARLESDGLGPSPEADKRTLIRRAYFDLTGLPPAMREVDDFIADKSPEAFARVVDRLLASPRYGERWGRHWLDVARYADTKGYVFEEERRYPYSYTYRDYVIRAFNEDLPFNQFIEQQIAADLLPPGDDKRALAALGYLTLGRRFINNINDIIDDRIDVVCRGMMGLTVACARCHDHKYDPIPTKDYYALYGVFSSSKEPDEEPLLGTKPEAALYDEYLRERKKREDERDKFREEKEDAVADDLRRKAGDYLRVAREADLLTEKSKLENLARKNKLDSGVVRRWMSWLEKRPKTADPVFGPWFELCKLGEDKFADGAKEIASQFAPSGEKSSTLNPLVAKMFEGAPPADLKEAADRYGKLFGEIDKRWRDAQSSTNAPKALPEAPAEELRQILYAGDAPANLPRNEFDRLFDVPTSQHLRALKRGMDELDATSPGAPPRAMAMEDRPDPHNTQVFIRGSPDNRGPEVPRHFPEVVAGSDSKPFTKGSGRLELAEDIASRDNPLTARVFINRVWMHHFGAPLVSTPSDFGLRSDPPTHPQLLDYLASRFMDEGWSVKKLHRWIMLSATYQQASTERPECVRVDPGNQLLWRMNRQRLEFEAMRDSLLTIAGNIDLKAGGHAVDIISEPFSTRRSVYGFIDRQNLPSLLRTFDFASPDSSNPRRFYTTVPQQALFLMNSPFIIQEARRLVERKEFQSESSIPARVRILYERALQRDPTREELALAAKFIQAPDPGPPADLITNWFFGYGMFDDASKRVSEFNKLPYYDGRAFQGGPTLPDSKLGWVVVSGTGGHPGGDQHHASIRRWVAPRDGAISISGVLNHPAPEGDGVRGRVVSSANGELGIWLVHNGKKKTRLEKVEVRSGEIIDFVTDCRQNEGYDSFNWSPTIRYMADSRTRPGEKMEWSALDDFSAAAQAPHDQPDVWERYAQVILLTNELVFVD